MSTRSIDLDLSTRLVHAGEPARVDGAVNLPIFQSSTFEYGGAGDYHDVRYIRLNNTPNHLALGDKLASLEGTEAALVTASGMAAIATTLLSLLKCGDHVIATRTLYGGTMHLFEHDLPALGITCSFVDAEDPAAWAAALTPHTRVVYTESMTNPLCEIGDLGGIAAFAKQHALVSVIDNTFASPVCFRPATLGFDLIVHSATKYLNGHSDIVAGAVMGTHERIAQVKRKLDHLGGTLDPHACFLLHRGLRTLEMRVRQQCATALTLATTLTSHPAVKSVHYACLPSTPGHARAKAWFDGFGGVFSFEPHGGVEAAERFLHGVRLAVSAPSLGGPETLVTRPATTSHAGMTDEARITRGINDALIRVAVGFESARDLTNDFAQALDS